MIKLTLVQYIRQFSIRKSIKDFNYLFFQGVGLVMLALVVMFISMYFYTSFLTHDREWLHVSFGEKMLYLLFSNREVFLTIQLGTVIHFLIMGMAWIKLRKTDQLPHENNNRMLESFAYGLLLVSCMVCFFGNIKWFFPESSLYSLRGSQHLYGWLSALLNYTLPALGFYLAYYFLCRGLGKKTGPHTWGRFIEISFLAMIILAFNNLIFGLVMHLVIEPIMGVFTYRENFLGLTLVLSISIAFLIFYMTTMADLLLILVNKKADATVPQTNADLLDA